MHSTTRINTPAFNTHIQAAPRPEVPYPSTPSKRENRILSFRVTFSLKGTFLDAESTNLHAFAPLRMFAQTVLNRSL